MRADYASGKYEREEGGRGEKERREREGIREAEERGPTRKLVLHYKAGGP